MIFEKITSDGGKPAAWQGERPREPRRNPRRSINNDGLKHREEREQVRQQLREEVHQQVRDPRVTPAFHPHHNRTTTAPPTPNDRYPLTPSRSLASLAVKKKRRIRTIHNDIIVPTGWIQTTPTQRTKRRRCGDKRWRCGDDAAKPDGHAVPSGAQPANIRQHAAANRQPNLPPSQKQKRRWT
jgi:hypothetical protein